MLITWHVESGVARAEGLKGTFVDKDFQPTICLLLRNVEMLF